MSRIDAAFSLRPIFMPYFPVGFPDIDTSVDVLEALAQGGADLIEVGLSFSDPLADGPVIQQATQTALERGVTTQKAIAAVAELRRRGVTIPLLLMGYYNPLLAYGLGNFVRDCLAAGADGFIIPDLPPEEADEFLAADAEANLPLITMLAPTTPDHRMQRLARSARGFLYLVSVTGVTGARDQLPEGLPELIARVRTFTTVHVCVGFGIGTPEQARAVGALADGVIVGSACVRAVRDSLQPVEAASRFARDFRLALR